MLPRAWGCLLIVLGFAFASPAIGACGGNSKCDKAQQLVDVLGYKVSIAALRESCVRGFDALHPNCAIARDPETFFGLTPASLRWLHLVTAFDTFTQQACGGSAFDEDLLDRYRASWQEHLTESQLDVALSFLRSPGGAAFAHGLLQTHRSVSGFYDAASAKMRREAWARFEREAQRIAREDASRSP